MSEKVLVDHCNCGWTEWTCSECSFKTFCDVEAMNHEHEYLDAKMFLTKQQLDSIFGCNEKSKEKPKENE